MSTQLIHQPVSAVLVESSSEEEPPGIDDKYIEEASESDSEPAPQSFLNRMKLQRLVPKSATAEPGPESGISNNRKLNISIMIAMPSGRRGKAHLLDAGDTDEEDGDQLPEVVVGSTETRWRYGDLF